MEPINSKKELEKRLIEKAMKDELFRDQLKTDPRGTIERELGITIPPSINLTVMEETPQTVYLVLPDPGGSHAVDELSQAELESVAGGWSGDSECGSCANESCPV